MAQSSKTVRIGGIVVPKELESRILNNRLYRSITRDIEVGERSIRNTPEMSVRLKTDAFKSASEHNEAFDDLIKSVEKLKLNRADLIEEILEDEKEKQRIMNASKVTVDQTIIQGDYVDDRDTIVKDSVISKSNIGAGGDDKVTKLEKIANLKREGLIDDAEFKQMKKEILGK